MLKVANNEMMTRIISATIRTTPRSEFVARTGRFVDGCTFDALEVFSDV
jgi:hypothetical protein